MKKQQKNKLMFYSHIVLHLRKQTSITCFCCFFASVLISV